MRLYEISPLILQKLIWVPTRLMLKFFGHLEISGMENLTDLKTNAIFACNHSSELDPFFVPASLGFLSSHSPLFYTTREKRFYDTSGWRQIFYGGTLFKMIGGSPVFVGLRDYEKSLSKHISLLKCGKNLCVFPEGGITPDGTIQVAKGGIAYLSETTSKPIIPVSISGTYRTNIKNLLLRQRNFKVHFGAPVYAKDLLSNKITPAASTGDAYKAAAQIVMNRIGDNMRKDVTAEVVQPAFVYGNINQEN